MNFNPGPEGEFRDILAPDGPLNPPLHHRLPGRPLSNLRDCPERRGRSLRAEDLSGCR